MAEAIKDMERWMSSGSSENEDDAPEEINFAAGKNRALARRQNELDSKRQQKDELKKKRREIETRNIVQKRAAIVEPMPAALLADVAAESAAKALRDDERARSKQSTKRVANDERKKKKSRTSKVEIPEQTIEFIPLSGVAKIPNKLVYKSRAANIELNFKVKEVLYDYSTVCVLTTLRKSDSHFVLFTVLSVCVHRNACCSAIVA